MRAPKQSRPNRRKGGASKLEPIDWHEFANDAVLNGNMSTLYHRPPTEDPSAYASPEALIEIEKRVGRPPESAVVIDVDDAASSQLIRPTVGTEPTVDTDSLKDAAESALINDIPTVGPVPTVGLGAKKKIKPLREVRDALTLAGQFLYKAMYGAPDGAKSKICTKGYRQLAAETHLDKDTVRYLIAELKDKGIIRQIETYDPDTRSAKTYEVLSYEAILQTWRDANFAFITTGRQRPTFCTEQGEILTLRPTVGPWPTAARRRYARGNKPTVGLMTRAPAGSTEVAPPTATEVIEALQQITGNPVDREAAARLINNCRTEAADCTIEEIVEFAWSKAFLCRSGKIDNPIGFLITQVPKHFQGEALQAYRDKKRKELEAAAVASAREEQRRQQSERELAEIEEEATSSQPDRKTPSEGAGNRS
jgi:hypothetical protein